MKTLAIDFDGVIHDYKNPVPGRRMGAPIAGAKEALTSLKDKGYEIVVFTVWGDEKGQKVIADFMNYYQLPFDRITNIKPQAEYYIDDKAIAFLRWDDVLPKL
jgi:ribonucleotide monophosphatase NagD (HAD superfamily)